MSRGLNIAQIAGALRQPNYGPYVGANLVSLSGTWMQRLAVQWLAWDLTHDFRWLGIVAFAELFPAIIASPVAGVIADRVNQKTLIQGVQVLAMGQAVALTILMLSGLMTIYWLAGLAVFLGFVMGFNHPVRMAFVHHLVSREYLATAISLGAVTFNLSRAVGPGLAAAFLFFGLNGVTMIFAINAASFVVFMVVLQRMDLPGAAARQGPRGSFFGDMRAGIAYAVGHPGIGPMLLMATATGMLLRPLLEMLAGVADELFSAGGSAFALLNAANAIGAVLGGLWLAQRGPVKGLTRVFFTAVLVMIGCMAAVTLVPDFWVAAGFLTVAGGLMIISGVGNQTLIQNSADPALRGRVLSLMSLIFSAAPAVGAAIIGFLAESHGFTPPFVGAALICLGVWLWTFRRRRIIAAVMEQEPAAAAPGAAAKQAVSPPVAQA
ncbi:MAG: MFS transporter [Alphaproteobacteria bacterium]